MTSVVSRDGAAGLLARERETLSELLTWVSRADADGVQQGVNRVRMAREWAKIAKATTEFRTELLRVEIACFARLAALGQVSLLPANQRAAARWWGDCHASAEDFIAAHPEAATATSLHRRVLGDMDFEQGKQRGSAVANGGYQGGFHDPLDGAIWKQTKTVRDAVAAILTDFTVEGKPFGVDEVVEQLLDEVGGGFLDWRTTHDEGFLEGVREVCRKAIRSYSSPQGGELDGCPVPYPAFVTARTLSDPSDPSAAQELWIRIPFDQASWGQLLEMLRLKRAQMEAASAAFRGVESVVNHLSSAHAADPEAPLGRLRTSQATGSSHASRDG